ncbi:MAG: hypothetical protein H6Q33_3924 [Deltaproteobacteria bacterium]|nr:hypothetical protein [Deltaproteobacteria bacterium]
MGAPWGYHARDGDGKRLETAAPKTGSADVASENTLDSYGASD